jgi:hypothetical protein
MIQSTANASSNGSTKFGISVSRIAVDLRKIEIPDWVLGGNYEDDPIYRERFQQWVDQIWTEKDQLISQMKSKYYQ